MTEERFSEMMNASDSDPVSIPKESNSVSDHTSELMKQIDMLQHSLDEVEDENFDLKFKLENSLKENQELCTEINDLKITLFKNASNDKQMFNDPSWKVRTNPEFDAPTKPSVVYSDCPEYPPSIFEKGETSSSSRKEPPSKIETNKVPVSVSNIKGNRVGRSKKNKYNSLNKNDRLSSETFIPNSCTSDSVILKSNSFDEHECKICSDKSKFMNFARKNLYCKHCWDNSFKYYSTPKSKKSKRKAKLNLKSNSNSDSSTQPKVFRAKVANPKSKKHFQELNVKMVWKWVPKPRYEWRVKVKPADIPELFGANREGPILIWVPKQN
ncbi:hypothetical protein L6452_22510 [Arctium lappa]|uniref:Uncharacterized protein n=1 Tax=Arctium lappa TaxID=4217 RepID=A0ACB9B4C2_ARCLA|nr:hypothetical protein L6452_22510 [Arctium lappa]